VGSGRDRTGRGQAGEAQGTRQCSSPDWDASAVLTWTLCIICTDISRLTAISRSSSLSASRGRPFQKPRKPDCPLVCLDETSKQLVVETRFDSGQTWTSRPARLRIRAKGRGQSIHDFRATGWRRVKVTDRYATADYAQMLKELTNQAAPRQSEHAHERLALRGLSRARSAPPRQTVRMALHPEARKLARHSRIRTRRPVEPMSEPAHSRHADPRKRSRRLGRTVGTSITQRPTGNSPQTVPA
jgi:hypothetical protein